MSGLLARSHEHPDQMASPSKEEVTISRPVSLRLHTVPSWPLPQSTPSDQDVRHLQRRSLQLFISEADERLKQLHKSSKNGNCTCGNHNEDDPSVTKALPAPPYHILEKKQKKIIVGIISLVAIFSPLSSNIYLPATDQIADVSCSVSSV